MGRAGVRRPLRLASAHLLLPCRPVGQAWAETTARLGRISSVGQIAGQPQGIGRCRPPAEAPWRGTVEPLGPGWAGLVLLARAAPYAKSQSNYSALFDMRTMEPLISGPPLVRALEELAAAAKLGPAEQLGTTRPQPGPRSGRGNAAWHWLALGREAGRQENDASADAGRDGPPADARKLWTPLPKGMPRSTSKSVSSNCPAHERSSTSAAAPGANDRKTKIRT